MNLPNFLKRKKKPERIVNKDIIEFRYALISKMYDGKSPMDPYTLSIHNEILKEFNNHFGIKYDLG